MRRIITATLILAGLSSFPAQAACTGLLDRRLTTLQGHPADLCDYQGKVVLVVNTASYCGNTPQYKVLEALYERYRERGLVVLGFPANDFGQQEPGSDQQVADFCERTYKVRFPMFSKSSVVKGGDNALVARLAETTGDWPEWNFHKYLLDRTGRQVRSFPAGLDPADPALVGLIEQWLATP